MPEFAKDNRAFALFADPQMRQATPYNDQGDYFGKARDRMERTFRLIQRDVPGKVVLDIGASPFYLLHLAKQAGAARCHGTYFANDEHSLRGVDLVHSSAGPIEISHSDAESDRLPFADNEVDVVSACEILEHFDHFPAHLAGEIRRVLKPGGLLCITVPNVASIAHILKLIAGKNIYMRYRSDSSGRHKHEYTAAQLRAFVRYLGMDAVRAGVLPSPTTGKKLLRPFYRTLALLPVLKNYSPILYILARQPDPKSTSDLSVLPAALYETVSSTEV
jgi:ubiquinone/menaquinone biosynthesis C-methylase UbiE